MKKCSYADKYKATRRPTCGCDACDLKWALKVIEKELKKYKPTKEEKKAQKSLNNLKRAKKKYGLNQG